VSSTDYYMIKLPLLYTLCHLMIVDARYPTQINLIKWIVFMLF
jgi:hypothetical protein